MSNTINIGEAVPLRAIIVGAGFGGIGMAIALRKAGIDQFVILEKAQDVGGVWRDNIYPGAACDVPSHLYSFSFEPNPDWSHVFATQPEIHAYLRRCAAKYDLERHLRFAAEVSQAVYDEGHALWRVTLRDGTRLSAAFFITAAGQLSRPVKPALDGLDAFEGHAFHSAQWDHACQLEGKRVAVIGTGASAIQFVPAIAGKVSKLSVFQRSAPYILPRGDRAYSRLERAMFRRLPWMARLYRAGIYLKYESRALAFTRFTGLMKIAAGLPFRAMLKKQVPDAALRARLVPDYPIGCKRILLSSDYLATMSKPNVELVSDPIRRVTPDGIETADGRRHAVDAIIHGTGFAASEFLSPMRIVGRDGLVLNDAWKEGADAYLGITVPGFPNFFMLYGPNTNLGHNSIVFMLESQVAHVMRCLRALRAAGAAAIEVDAERHRRFNAGVRQRLARTVWNGCKSWYVDQAGRNSINWPGFTVTYRWLARRSSLAAYTLSRPCAGKDGGELIAAPGGLAERFNAGMVRLLLRTCFRPFAGPPWGIGVQRAVSAMLSLLAPGVGGVGRARMSANGVPVDIVTPADQVTHGAILYIHGGAFVLGSPAGHRSMTSRLAVSSGMPVWVPDYRLAPEHPYPAALDDVRACYEAMLAQGLRADQIVIGGDSAGGALALALAILLKQLGAAQPAGLLLVSPVTDPALAGATMQSLRGDDPMVRQGWVEQALRWYACPPQEMTHRPLEADLAGLAPMLIQAGEQEVLLADSTRLAAHAASCGVPCKLEVYAGRWHVFHLSAFFLESANHALRRLARFARECVDNAAAASAAPAMKGNQP